MEKNNLIFFKFLGSRYGGKTVFLLLKIFNQMGRAFEYRKARKMKRWSNMARVFTRVGREISIAVKEGGADPNYNARLRMAIQNAKTANMPKANVDNAIKKATSKEATDYQELVYEGYAPHGIAVIVETATDNPTRTVANVRHIFSKNGGNLSTSGSVDYMFNRKAYFKAAASDLNGEELELELIDFGLDYLETDGQQLTFWCLFEDFGKLQKGLEEKNIEVLESEIIRIPSHTNKITEDQVEEVIKLIEKMEEDDDVLNVFHNMDMSE
jgi:YebC/PmpR family DNA-binding regulatory protein